jgi:hypothetical protein
LFWFEKTSKLKAIEENMVQRYAIVQEAIPTMGFQKWVTTILSTTQVSQNVILLALLFIYRLKKFNTGVRGKKGSEFRLMTIALMMGNKCELSATTAATMVTDWKQFSMTIRIPTKHGPRSRALGSRKSTSWRSSFSATCGTTYSCLQKNGRTGTPN